ncbi:MAG TPA: calcium-binding protein [Allosphingosinicella sp.]|jgi:Ca2+-binding RTX toxin-like protein
MPILIVGAGGFATIQLAVNAAAAGDTIVIQAGTYVEQVIVDQKDGLTIRADAGAVVTIQAPADLVETARSSSDREIHAVFTVKGSLGVTLEDIGIDGRGAGNTVDEGGGFGIANFYGVYYRSSSGTLENVDIVAVRDPYPGGSTPGGQPNVDGVQRGVGLVVDNDSLLPFAMHGGSIGDFQKQAATFVRADLDVSGVTVSGGGAQPVIAQNGFSINRSTGTVTGNTITDIGYAGPANAYSGAILASSNTDLVITDNVLGGSNGDKSAAKVVGVWIYQNGPVNSGGEISGNIITSMDVGIAVDDAITPDGLSIHDNDVSQGDLSDPFSAGVRFEPTPTFPTPFVVEGSAMHDKLSGAAAADTLTALAGDDTLNGGAGDDILDGGAGIDTMSGGVGDDSYHIDDSLDVFTEDAAAGTDKILTSLASFSLSGLDNFENLTGTSATGQQLTGNDGTNVVVGAAGNDILNGGAGADEMRGGLGDDGYVVDDAGDLVVEQADEGDDAILTTLVSLTLGDNVEGLQYQGIGNFTGTGNGLDNLIGGDEGNDTLDGAAGADAMTGGLGNDIYLVDNLGDEAIETDASHGIDTVRSSVSFTLGEHMENLRLTGAETIDGTGNELANFLAGNAAANRLNGAGDADTMAGGAGDDYYIVDNVGDRTFETAGQGIDTVRSTVDYTFGGHVENLILVGPGANGIGNSQNNVMSGTLGANVLSGENGFDTLNGLGGNDKLFGGGNDDLLDGGIGADELYGGVASDTLLGGAGRDLLHGEGGHDLLTGGEGHDRFYFDTALDRTSNVDQITDFLRGTDKIMLDRAVFAETAVTGTGALAPGEFHVGAAAADAGDRIIYNGVTGQLFYDADGLGGAEQIPFARLSGAPPLTNTDFIGYI